MISVGLFVASFSAMQSTIVTTKTCNVNKKQNVNSTAVLLFILLVVVIFSD